MQTTIRALFVASCLAFLAVAGCGGGSPTEPTAASGGAGATIAGTVHSAAAGAPSGLTVTVVGTGLSAAVENAGQFRLAGVPSGNVELQFRASTVNATARLSNVGQDEMIEIQVNLSGSTATIVNEVRSGKVALCHSTGNGSYQLIEVSVSAEPAHRAHGDAKIGEPVPADVTKVFDSDCRPVGASVRIKKSTNGEDADQAPGPTIAVGSPVTWQYVVTNTGTVSLTDVRVTDDRNVTVSCPGTILPVGQSMTCVGSGTATAGQYRNVGTVRAQAGAVLVTSSDASHYLGQAPNEEQGPKVQLCHRTGNGSYHLIEVSVNAEPAHRAHGDGKIGEAVPGSPGKVFDSGCNVR